MSILYPFGTKNKTINFVRMKTSHFIFYGLKSNFDIFIGTKNFFNPFNYLGTHTNTNG